jgi:hypothetical protein
MQTHTNKVDTGVSEEGLEVSIYVGAIIEDKHILSTCILKTLIYNLVCMMRFWNNLHRIQVRSRS